MKRFILSATLTITCFISKAQISQNDSVSTSAATVPSGQVLYLNFNNNFNDQSGFNNAVSNYNVTFTADQSNAANAAASFDGCAGNRAYLKVGNSANLQVSNAMTISFWAKVDLSMGMNPHDGACSSVGHHILFAKGGDGYGTSPNGFYSKLEPDGSNATNLFGSSSNSGNLAYNTTINSPNSWKFYTYVITSTQYQLYINGTLQNSSSHNINFNEINNEDLYIGVLGPKSTPALGIANWYPMRGQIDDFRVFNRALNNTEINGLYAPEETGGDAPAITQIQHLGDSYYFSGSTEYHLKTLGFNFNDESILLAHSHGRFGSYGAKIIKITRDTTVSKAYSSNNNWSYPIYHTQKNFIRNENRYYTFSATGVTVIPTDSLWIHDSNLNFINKVRINGIYYGAFTRNSQLVVLSKNSTDTGILYVTVYDQNGNFQNQITIQDSINDFAYDSIRLALVSDTKLYIFHYDLNVYNINQIGAKNVKLATNNIILIKPYETWVCNLLTSSIKVLNSVPSQCFVSDNNQDYYIVSNGYLSKYDNNSNLVYGRQIPAYTDINFKKDYILLIRKITISHSTHYGFTLSLLNLQSNSLLYESNYSFFSDSRSYDYFYDGAVDFSVLPSQEILIVRSKDIVKISSTGSIIWKKNIPTRHIFTNNDNSFWLVNADLNVGLMHIQNDNNKCVYEVKNPFLFENCSGNQAKVMIKGNYPLVRMSSLGRYFFPTLDKLGIQCRWYKDGQLTDTTFYGNFSGSGVYKLVIKQQNCNVESSSNYIHTLPMQSILPPNLVIDKPVICQGQSAVINASCSSGTHVNWLDTGYEPSRTVSPDISTTYSAWCRKESTFYGLYNGNPPFYLEYGTKECTSPNTTATVNVYDGNQVTNLSGVAVGGMDYKGGKIISTQTIPGNQRNTYQFIKSAELRGSFSAANGSVLTIEADETCNN